MQPNNEERQVATRLEDIRRDHVARYEWAAERVRGLSVVDLGCGVGYGTSILGKTATSAQGFDADRPTIEYAWKHWGDPLRHSPAFVCHNLYARAIPAVYSADAAVAFEVIEHLEDPRFMLRALKADTLLASVPNEDVFPWANYKYHHRHYTKAEFEALLNECGWIVTEWWGQEGTQSEVERDVNGRTLIAVCERGTASRVEAGSTESVHLVGLGPSKYELTELMIQHDYEPPWDELWTVNKGVALFPHADRVFVMDDIYDYGTKHPAYGAELRAFKGQIIGQTSLPNDGSIPFTKYPLRKVLNYWGQDCEHYLHTISIPLIIAYAGMIGVKRLFLSGIDCAWDGRPDLREDGASVVTHWLGRFIENNGPRTEQGRCININSSSALNDTNKRGQYGRRQIYGWLRQPLIYRDEAGEYHVNFGDGWDVD